MTMNKHLIALGLCLLPGLAAAQDYEMCFYTAVTEMIPAPDGIIGAEACEAACQDADTCTAWTYKPHSFEPATMAGTCRLMPDVYQTDESTSNFCGRIER